MAIKALDLSKVRDFISVLDDGDDPTIWKLGTLTSRDVGAIRDSSTTISFGRGNKKGEESEEDIKTNVSRSKMNFEAVRRSLKGVENFLDDEGNAVPFKLVTRDVGGGVKKSVVSNEFMDRIPLAVVEEMAEVILEENMSDDEAEDAGNSPEPSTDGSSTPTEDAPPAQT